MNTYQVLVSDILNDTAYLRGLKRGYQLGSFRDVFNKVIPARSEDYNQEVNIYEESIKEKIILIKATPEFKDKSKGE